MVKNNGSALEPSSGTGIFLDLIPRARGIELDQSLVRAEHADRVTVSDFFDAVRGEQFDTIIGNPPYVCTKNNSRGKVVKHRVKQSFVSTYLTPSANFYLRFIERAFLELLTPGGELIFIVPSEFFQVTSAASLREAMLQRGTFTDVWFDLHDEWDASVEVCVFRYQLGQTDLPTLRDGKRCYLVNSDGILFFLMSKPQAFLGDYFEATVGARPRKSNVKLSPGSGLVEFGSNKGTRWCSLDEPWPRSRKPLKGEKILFEEGPTRKGPYFVTSTCDRFLSCALIPKQADTNLQAWVEFLEGYQGWEELNIRVNGRWRVGPRLMMAVPLMALPKEVT